MQPMLQPGLQIEHAPFIAPCLNFFDARPIRFRDAQLRKTEGLLSETRIVQSKFFTAPCGEIGENLPFDELRQRFFGSDI